MGSSGPGNTPKRVSLGFLVQVIIVIIGVLLIKHQKNVSEVSEQNTNTVTQVVDNWNVLPFIDLDVTDDKCPASTDPVFVRSWGGTQTGCLVNKLNWTGYGSS